MTRIATHDGTFHCDEALACYMLLKLHPEATIVRTRDPEIYNACEFVVDVGGVYHEETNRFDHHQRGFTETLSSLYPIKLSSAGLVYKHFGAAVILKLYPQLAMKESVAVFVKMYERLIASVDAIDNGLAQYENLDQAPLYEINSHLASRVARLNSPWGVEEDSDQQMKRFMRAVEITGTEFAEMLESICLNWLPMRSLAMDVLEKRFSAHTSGKILVMETGFPWKEQIMELELEQEIPVDQRPLYALYPDSAGAWRIQSIPECSWKPFSQRKGLPEPWRGVRDEQLSTLSGIPGCVFVRKSKSTGISPNVCIDASGFIGANKTFEGAMKMAVAALDFQ